MVRTREEERERKRAYRARKRAEAQGTAAPAPADVVMEQLAIVTPIGGHVAAFGSVTKAVEEEVELLPLARTRKADVATALAMARILDDPKAIPQHPSAAARLLQLMDGLRAEVDGGRNKLQTLRSGRAAR